MTDDELAEMFSLARANLAESGVTNAEFLEGRIEAVPLPDHSVDVVDSHTVADGFWSVFVRAHKPTAA